MLGGGAAAAGEGVTDADASAQMVGMEPMSSWTRDSVPVVTVRGAWRGEVPPEVARVYVTVSARGADRPTVLTQISGRVDELRATLDGYGEAVERVDAHPLRVSARMREGRGRNDKVTERVTGYSAEADFTILATDFDVLGDMLLRVADREMVALRGPEWSLRRDSAAQRGARAAACETRAPTQRSTPRRWGPG
jgi:uncharacterized protein YggE